MVTKLPRRDTPLRPAIGKRSGSLGPNLSWPISRPRIRSRRSCADAATLTLNDATPAGVDVDQWRRAATAGRAR